MTSTATADAPRMRAARERAPGLPAPLTSFIGREKALAAVSELTRAHRLVTLLGPGGAGKTRLAIEVARGTAHMFDDGVVWVELAPLSDAALLAQTIATTLGIRHQPGRVFADAIAEYLAARDTLLILDNCEHLIDAAATVVDALLRAAPKLHVLATSRERLSVSGERAWQVPPLSLPDRTADDVDVVLGAEAVRLFIDRATAVLPAFALDPDAVNAIADICRRCDGIPLAIELAAARMNVLAPQQIAARLGDAMTLLTTGARTLPKRQRTLRAAIDWSHALLGDAERVLFRRLSVFGGDFTLDAAEAVCSDDVLPARDVLDLIAGLVDKSLVAVRERAGDARYRLLVTVRQYATEQLANSGDDHATHQRHALHYAAIVDYTGPKLRSAMRPRILPIVDAEIDNIRAALDWTGNRSEWAAVHHRMVAQLWWYWLHRVLWDEALQRVSVALDNVDDVPPALLAHTLYGGGILAWVSGDFVRSRAWLERCVEIYRDTGDARGIGMALCALATPVQDLGESEHALALVREGMPLVRAGCTPWEIAVVLTSAYGYVHHANSLWDDAEQAYQEADALWSEPPDDWGRSLARNSIGVVSWRKGNLERADRYARDSLALVRRAGDRWFASRTLQVLGYTALARARVERATEMLAASEALRREVGARLMPFEVPEWMRALDAARLALGTAFDEIWQRCHRLDFDAAIDLALEIDHRTSSERVAGSAQGALTDTMTVTAPASRLQAAELVIRALGPLEVQRAGRIITAEDWTYAKPRELLFYLLVHPEGRTKDQVGLDLWPEASPARLRSSFHVTMHHLRRVLGGPDWVTYQDGRYSFERTQECDYDVARFLSLLDAAAHCDDADPAPLLEEAVSLYRGDFLEDAGFGDWTLEQRDLLARRFADAVIELGRAQHRAGAFDLAADTVRKLLARDNLDERAHRLLIECLADAGRTADALRHHGVLTALYREELGIAPSAATEALIARIRLQH